MDFAIDKVNLKLIQQQNRTQKQTEGERRERNGSASEKSRNNIFNINIYVSFIFVVKIEL